MHLIDDVSQQHNNNSSLTNSPSHSIDRVTGTIYLTSQCHNNPKRVGFGYLYVKSDQSNHTTNKNGWYSAQGATTVEARLDGRYCSVFDCLREEQGMQQLLYAGPPTFDWNKSLNIGFDDKDFRSLMAFYHVTSAYNKFIDVVTEPLLNSLDNQSILKPMHVSLNESVALADEAVWDGQSCRIRFGINVPFVLDSLVTFHEYGHAIIDLITGDLESGMGLFPTLNDASSDEEMLAVAVCEAYADYLACSFQNYPKILENSMYERDLNVPNVYDPSLPRDDPYRDSLPLSTGLWELRDRIGQSTVDQGVIRTLFLLRERPHTIRTHSLQDAVLSLIEVDQVLNPPPKNNTKVIAEVFKQRGIL